MGFNITDLSPAYNQSQLLSSVGVAMLAKTMDNAESIGANMAQMIDAAAVSPAAMELSVNPAVGANFDISV